MSTGAIDATRGMKTSMIILMWLRMQIQTLHQAEQLQLMAQTLFTHLTLQGRTQDNGSEIRKIR